MVGRGPAPAQPAPATEPRILRRRRLPRTLGLSRRQADIGGSNGPNSATNAKLRQKAAHLVPRTDAVPFCHCRIDNGSLASENDVTDVPSITSVNVAARGVLRA